MKIDEILLIKECEQILRNLVLEHPGLMNKDKYITKLDVYLDLKKALNSSEILKYEYNKNDWGK